MSDSDNSYFQFPLCSLAYGGTVQERLNTIISFGFVETGFVMLNKLDLNLRKLKVDEICRWSGTPTDFRKHNSEHIAAMLGAMAMRITSHNIEASLQNWRKLSCFRNQFQAQHGPDAKVRIRGDMVFEMRDKKGMGYREFAIFCAILSSIGAKKYPVRITRLTIQSRMLGYKSQALMRAELAKRTDGEKPLTPRQINITLDKLHERQFFARARANERQTFYSTRLTQDQLQAALIDSKTYSQGFHQRRRQRDAELIAKIKDAKSAIKVDIPIIVDPASEHSTNGVHSASTGVSTPGSTEGSTLIQTPIIETISIETSSIKTPAIGLGRNFDFIGNGLKANAENPKALGQSKSVDPFQNQMATPEVKRAAYDLALQIGCNDTSWHWDNCKIWPGRLKISSLTTAAIPWLVNGLQNQQLLKAWKMAVVKAHAAVVDGLARKPEAYAIACWRKELKKLSESVRKDSEQHSEAVIANP